MGTESAAVRGIGTLLYMYDDAGANPVKVSEVVDLDENKTLEIIDATHMDSPDEYREKTPGMKNAGQITVSCHYVPGSSTQAQLDLDFENRFKRKFHIKLSVAAGGEQRTFFAYVANVGRPYKLDDLMRFNITLEVTGKVVPS